MGPAVFFIIALISVCQCVATLPGSCPKVSEPPASPHPPLPAGQYRYPYNMGDLIIHDIGDGCPDIDINRFNNSAEICPAIWREECIATKGSDEDPTACKCGPPSAGKAQTGCHQCIGQPHHLEFKPPNATAIKAKDVCGRYPPITRRQMIERALGWVSNGFLYGKWNSTSGGGTPETCGSEDEAECPQYSYESVCNGLLEMAWKSDDTNKGPGKPKKSWPPTKIDCLDVKPGDWLHTGEHMQMFRRWVNGSGYGKQLVLYQMGGGWGKANAAIATFNKDSKSTKPYNFCFRRPNIIDDDNETPGHYCSTHAETARIMVV